MVQDDRSIEDRLLEGALNKAHYKLRLYVTGNNPRSQRAVANLRRICDTYLPGRCDLEVIDLYQEASRAGEAQIFAAPTLVKDLPLPLRRIIGDLSDESRVLVALEISNEE